MAGALVTNDLRAFMYRSRGAVLLLGNLALIALVGVAATWVVTQSNAQNPGSVVLQWIGLGQLALLLAFAPWWACGTVEQERNGTWDLLVLSSFSSASIAMGKFLGSVAGICLLLATTLPDFAVTSLFGTVEVSEIATVYLFLLLTAVALCAAGILASFAKRTRWRRAVLLAPSVLTVVNLPATIVVSQTFSEPTNLLSVQRPLLGCLSPVAAFESALPGNSAEVLVGFPVWSAYGLACLAIAALLLYFSNRLLRQQTRRGQSPTL